MKKILVSIGIAMLLLIILAGIAYAATGVTDPIVLKDPMLGHIPGMPPHYDLHVWVWQPNPDGMFAIWNPKVTCP